jgi:ketosteroid isomerase-like protein
VGSDEFDDAEHALLQALQRQDLDTLTALLTDDFLITTAGWIAEPADKSTWLAGLAEHQLDEFKLRLVAVQRYGNVGVVLAESAQKGSRSGERWEHTFRYTDVWLNRNARWLLAVRHASAVRPKQPRLRHRVRRAKADRPRSLAASQAHFVRRS